MALSTSPTGIPDHLRLDSYATTAGHVVIDNNEMHQRLVDALPLQREIRARILDLGCGTGHGMELILKRFPHAHVTGIDIIPGMIQQSAENLRAYGTRTHLVQDDFTKMELPSELDAITSAVAIHNVTHDEKRKLFGEIYNTLKSGGVFINADFCEPEVGKKDTTMRSALEAFIAHHPGFRENHDFWLESVGLGDKHGALREVRRVYETFLRKHLKGPELDAWLYHAFQEDMPMPLTQQLEIHFNNGFRSSDILWQRNNQTVYRVTK